jgi:hypothetical protein
MNKTHGSVQAPWFRAGSLDNFMREIRPEFPVSVVSGFGHFRIRSFRFPFFTETDNTKLENNFCVLSTCTFIFKYSLKTAHSASSCNPSLV